MKEGALSPKASSDKPLTLVPVPEGKLQGAPQQPTSPVGGGEKGRKQFYSRLNRLIEDNLRLKMQQKELKHVNADYLNQVGHKEHEVKDKGDFVQLAKKELDHRHLRYQQIRLDYEALDTREKANAKNLKGLIAYAKKLTLELEQQREKVAMAESIISDLKQAGSDNIDSLMNLMESYKLKQQETQREIKKMKQLTVLKDDELVTLDQDIQELSYYLGTAKDKLEAKTNDLLKVLEENKRIIRKQDKHIVDMQQRNEISQSSIVEANLEAGKKDKEKGALNLKLKELEGKRTSLNDNIRDVESKIVSYRSIYAT